MKSILLIAYQLSPTKGSEYSVAWNFILNMSPYYKLTVLYGVSDKNLGETQEMEQYLQTHEIDNTSFIKVSPSGTARFLNRLNERGIFSYSFYLAYREWQKSVFLVAQELVKSQKPDVIHFLNPIGYREPGYVWKLGLPYVWGPIGGFNNIPTALLSTIPSLQGRVKSRFRTAVNNWQMHFGKRIRQAVNRTDVLLVSTTECARKVRQLFHKESIWLPENGITRKPELDRKKFAEPVRHLIWIGRIDEFKGLGLLLEALRRLPSNLSYRVDIVGDGPLRTQLETYANRYGLQDRLIWHGQIKREHVFELLEKAHLHLITSLSEANTTVLWEAMTAGVPTISVDHCGMHDVICERCGVRIPLQNPEQVKDDLSAAIQKVLTQPGLLEKLSEGTLQCSEKFLWSNRIPLMESVYNKAIIHFNEAYGS